MATSTWIHNSKKQTPKHKVCRSLAKADSLLGVEIDVNSLQHTTSVMATSTWIHNSKKQTPKHKVCRSLAKADSLLGVEIGGV